MVEETLEENRNGDEGFQKWLDEQTAAGNIMEPGEFFKDGRGLIQPPEVKHSNASIIASVPDGAKVYGKKENDKALLLDLMARTNFRNHTEFVEFTKFVRWCEDYGIGLEEAMRYVVGITSEGGLSRQQYLEAITVFRMRSYNNNDRTRFKNNGTRESGLS